MRTFTHFLVSAVLSGFILGCGGGDGGGVNNNAAGSNNTSRGSVQLNQTSLTFSADFHETSWVIPQQLTATASGITQDIFISVDLHRSKLIENAYIGYTTNGGWLDLEPKSPKSVGPGEHTETLSVSVCYDSQCTNHVEGSPLKATINYNVTGAVDFTLSPESLYFESYAQAEALPQPQTVNLSASTNVNSWSQWQQSNWFSLNIDWNDGTGTATVAITEALAEGTYTGTAFTTVFGDWSERQIPITYTVLPAPIVLSNETPTFELSSEDPTLAEPKQIQINSINEQPVDWQVKSDTAWLSLSTTQGNTGSSNTLTLSINEHISKVESRELDASIVFYNNDFSYKVPVRLINHMPVIHSVAPPMARPNLPQTITLIGEGFSNLTTDLKIGNVALSSYQVVNDKKLIVTLPALTEGSHVLAFDTPFPFTLTPVDFKVKPAHVFTEDQLFPNAQHITPTSTVYDFIDDCFYISMASAPNNSEFTIERICYNSSDSTWQSSFMQNNGVLYEHLYLTPDFKFLIASDNSGVNISVIDIETFTPSNTYSVPEYVGDIRLVFYSNRKADIVGDYGSFALDIYEGISSEGKYFSDRNSGIQILGKQGDGSRVYYRYGITNEELNIYALDLLTTETNMFSATENAGINYSSASFSNFIALESVIYNSDGTHNQTLAAGSPHFSGSGNYVVTYSSSNKSTYRYAVNGNSFDLVNTEEAPETFFLDFIYSTFNAEYTFLGLQNSIHIIRNTD